MNKYIKQLLNNVKINRYEIESSLTGLLCIFFRGCSPQNVWLWCVFLGTLSEPYYGVFVF